MHYELVASRRDFLRRAGGGCGALALASLVASEAHSGSFSKLPSRHALAPHSPHLRPTAKAVIWCFLDGGPSHIDLFDPKPELNKLNHLNGRIIPNFKGSAS